MLEDKVKNIRLCLFDIDGIFTSGLIYYAGNNNRMRAFHVQDGLGISLLKKAGLEVGVISAKHSEDIQDRLQDLQLKHVYLGHEDKLPIYEKLKQELHLEDKHISYMGDDLPDLPLLERAGLAITVPQAPQVVRQIVDYVTTKQGGFGAVREVCEWILNIQTRILDKK
jgi:3-deoxy-D-manno-octulosonate 8-phosphate phosphatase (KDO 8-P phosphatase)